MVMDNDPIVFQFAVAQGKPHSYRKDKPKTVCPFCDTENLVDVYCQEGEMIWLKNKFPTLRDTLQTVLIESHDHYGDISNYSKEENRKLLTFALDCFQQMRQDQRFESVCWYKNYGPQSGGSLIHPHMQIVGFDHENCYKYIHENNFEGVRVFTDGQVEVNIADHPVQGYTEINLNVLQLNQSAIDVWADWIRAGAKYMLNVMHHGRFNSYNLFFYPRADGGICAKYIARFFAPPYFVGYKLSQVNDEDNLAEEAENFRNFFTKELDGD